jgi:type II secretory pathway pseudopilin PulG
MRTANLVRVSGRPAQPLRARSGYTLIELMVVSVIVIVLVTAVATILVNSQNAFSTGSTIETVQATAYRLANDIASELKNAKLSTLSPSQPSNSTSISFQKVLGYTDGVSNTSTLITYAYQTNSDPKLGNGRLVRTQDSKSVTQGNFIRALNPDTGLPGFCVTRNGNSLTVSVTVEQSDVRGLAIRYASTTTVCSFTP